MFGTVMEKINNLTMIQKILVGVAILVILYVGYSWYSNRNAMAQPPYHPMMMMHPSQEENYENTEGGDDELVCTMFYTTWCGACKNAKPEWEKFKEKYNGKVINGKKILIVGIDCDKEKEIAEREGIEGYPTFKFNLKGKNYDYPDQPVFEKFKTFLEYLVGLEAQ